MVICFWLKGERSSLHASYIFSNRWEGVFWADSAPRFPPVLTLPSLPHNQEKPVTPYKNSNSIGSWKKILKAALQIKPQNFMTDGV